MKTFLISFTLAAASVSTAYPSTKHNCTRGFSPGIETTLFTIPYTYDEVLSVIGDFKNLSWIGIHSVDLNGTDNTVGATRTYEVAGTQVVETITKYSKPPKGPFEEVHTLSPITITSANITTYAEHDGIVITPICGGAAVTFEFQIEFCSTNASVATQLLHWFHLQAVQNVGLILGGQTFTSCGELPKYPHT